jgi:hypothetical protein
MTGKALARNKGRKARIKAAPASDKMTKAHLATEEYKQMLPGLILTTEGDIVSAEQPEAIFLRKLALEAREKGVQRGAGFQLLCALEVLLQSLAHRHAIAVPLIAAGAGAPPANHMRSLRGRRCRLGDLLPFSALAVLDGLAFRERLESMLRVVQPRLFNNKLQELGLCPPGPPERWGRGKRSLWRQAWGGGGKRLVILHA